MILRHASALRQYSDYEKWTNTYLKYGDLQRRERHIYHLYLELVNGVSASKTPSEVVVKKSEIYAKHVCAVLGEDSTSFILILFAYNTLYLCAQCQGSINDMLSACLSGLEELNKLPFEVPSFARFTFTWKALYLSIKQGKYENIEGILSQASRGAYNRRNKFVVLRLEAVYWLRKESLSQAKSSIDDLSNLSQSDQEAEEITLLKGFHNFLCLLKKQEPSWKIELSNYRSDKTGNYATALIISLITDLSLQKHDDLVDRSDAFMQYAYRHLNKKPFKDKFYLFKALATIPNNGFQKTTAMVEGQKFIEKIGPPGIQSGLEILPLKKIWEYAISTL